MFCVCLLLLSAPWKTVKPMSDVPRCKLCGCRDPHECPPGFKVSPPPPMVPRVARSVDDLRVGMVVAWEDGGSWDADALNDHDDLTDFKSGWPSQVVILADAPDPPARDWLVPAAQMEALREALIPGRWPAWDWDRKMRDAARAVLDAAREVEHE